MAEVFISYAREDQGFARDIHAALQKVNRDTWIDWRSIPDSAKWRAEIFAAIEAADNFLFVISPDSAQVMDVRARSRLMPLPITSGLSPSSITRLTARSYFRRSRRFNGLITRIWASSRRSSG